MKSVKLENPNEIISKIDFNDFYLTKHYIDYDNCYLDKDWIEYTIYYNDITNEPLVVIAKRLPDDEIGHILIVEVNNRFQRNGFGRIALQDYMQSKKYWELWSLESSEEFYKKVGFKMDKKSELYIYGFESLG